jgi:hypothetical protein
MNKASGIKLAFYTPNLQDMKNSIFILLTFGNIAFCNNTSFAQGAANDICGRWVSRQKNLIVDVYREDNDYKARIVWFNAGSEQKMEAWCDTNNPVKALRSRKVIGLNILNSLQYEPASRSYENGMIYYAMHGHEWNASAYITKQGQLSVEGYWHFKFIGKTMLFNRVMDEASLNKTAPQPSPQHGVKSI